MVGFFLDGDAIVRPFVARIEVTGASQGRLADGSSPTVDHVLKLVLAQRKVEGCGPNMVSIFVIQCIAIRTPAVEAARDVDDIRWSQFEVGSINAKRHWPRWHHGVGLSDLEL